jgi:hypothetical protein
MLIRGLLLSALLSLTGCLQAYSPDGYLVCSGIPDRECPMGYYCERTSMTCWHNGDVPDLTFTPPAMTPLDLSIPVDMSTHD